VDKVVETVDKLRADDTFKRASGALGIFAKEPTPGRVKTRLCPPLSATEAADLYRASLEETVAIMASGPWATTIFYDGSPDFFSASFPGIAFRPQSGADLGSRMARALLELLDSHDGAVLIGSDSPDLPLERVHEAFAALQNHDAVIAPAVDGGYVLIGESRHHPELFQDIPWSTTRVLPRTRQRVRDYGIRLCELATWEDLDDIDSLHRLIARSPLSRTAQYLRSLALP
jgi:uncharacterized protein